MQDNQPVVPDRTEIHAETNATRKAVLVAMQAMLTGRIEGLKPNQLTTARLAREAGINRNQVTQGQCRDLGNRFKQLVAASLQPATPLEVQLSAELATLRSVLAATEDAKAELLDERDKWKASTLTLLRAVQVMRLQSEQDQAQVRSLKKRLERTTNPASSGLFVVPDA